MGPRAGQSSIEVRETRRARFVMTEDASFFVPGVIPASPAAGRPPFKVVSMSGELLGRPIVTIPPEEAG
jgi:hypothetical protein